MSKPDERTRCSVFVRQSLRASGVAIALLFALIAASCGTAESTAPSSPDLIERTQVLSSAMKSIGYSKSENILELEFPDGSVYRYYDVPRLTCDGLMAAESHGRYFHRHIRNAGYRYEKVSR